MTAEDALQKARKFLEDHFDGQLDILVNNAGWCPIEPLFDINRTSYEQAFDLDVEAVILLSAGLLDLLKKAKGTIFNMSSVGGSHAAPNISLYVAARAMKSKD